MALDGWLYLLPAAVLAVWIFRRSGRFFQALLFSAVTGNLALLGVGYLGAFTGVALLPNLFTVGTATLFGVPGVLTLLILRVLALQ